MSNEEETKVKLITLLNVANGRSSLKRKPKQDWHALAKRAKSAIVEKSVNTSADGSSHNEIASHTTLNVDELPTQEDDASDDDTGDSVTDPYTRQYAAEPAVLTEKALKAVEENSWTRTPHQTRHLGSMSKMEPSSGEESRSALKPVLGPRLKSKLDTYLERQSNPSLPLELLDLLGNYKDALFSDVRSSKVRKTHRSIASLHIMNHLNKGRSKILKNNEALAKADESATSERETRDQGFTRPKVLVLVPFRNSAAQWMDHLIDCSLASQVENSARFKTDFGLPDGAIDKLAQDEKDAEGRSKYPLDHRETFKGNIDDTFRVGMKITRKSLKLYSDFYQSDLILASPLGLRTSIESQKSSDFLSSIEIVIADQLDVMSMQNWEHFQFVMAELNKIPKESHGVDFSRVKPWYLDGQAQFLRQTVLLSAYDTPEIRSLYNRTLKNIVGRYKTEQTCEGVLDRILSGVKQTFSRFETPGLQKEDDARFTYFTTKTLPAIRKSAVASSNTIIFIPSYFDYVRLNAYLKTHDDFNYAVLNEYSSNSEISRARTNFFKGNKPFLLVTERFHFFRRYKIRGARTVVFYAPPEHADFYAEYLEYPFLTREVAGTSKNRPDAEMLQDQLQPEEVSCQVVFSKYDLLRLERIVGAEDARRMCLQEAGEKFSFE